MPQLQSTTRSLAFIAALALMLIASAAPASAQTSNPMQVFGVTGAGDIRQGDLIVAYLDGTPVGSSSATADGWVIDILDGLDGQVMTFTINGRQADQTATHRGFESTEVTLTLSGPSGDGSLTRPSFGSGTVGSAVYGGGSVNQLVTQIGSVGGESVWAQDSGGRWLRYSLSAVGATGFVNNAFTSAFASGFDGATAVFVVKTAPPSTTSPAPTPTPTPTAPAGKFTVIRTSVTYNIIGTPEANVTVRNDSRATIDAFDVQICAFNAFGEPVLDYGFDPHCFRGVAGPVRIAPGETYTGVWTLYGQDTAENVNASPMRSRTTSGTTWTP